MSETFTCESCGENREKGWSDAEAAAEAEELFPGIDASNPAEAGVVCDDCYQYIMGLVHAEVPELIGAGWRQAGREHSRCYQMPSGALVHVQPGCRCR